MAKTYMGFEKEPPQPHGPKMRGRSLVHSHSARPKHKLSTRKGGRKRAM
jgi:hypothetical protein